MSLSAGEVTAIVMGIGNFTAWAKLFFDARKNGKNGNGKPCSLHSGIESQIATQKTELADELKNLHAENRQDHQQIFADIKGLSIAVAGAAAAAANAAVAATASRKRAKP